MKTISTLLLTGLLGLCSMSAQAQSWAPGNAPHQNSRYYDGYGLDYTHRSTHHAGRAPRYGYGYGPHHTFGHTSCPVTFQTGFVTKRFVSNGRYCGRYCENLWGDEGRFMNGLQLGFAFQPTMPSGLGFRSGVFYEAYFANGRGVQDLGYDRFCEHDLYIPLHLAYDIPLSRDSRLDLTTGLGFNTALAGVYRDWGRYGNTDYQAYGNDGLPDRINAMWEFGAEVNFDRLSLGFTYGLGLNDHEFYDDTRTRQNKFSLTAALTF